MPAAVIRFPDPAPDAPPFNVRDETLKILREALAEIEAGTLNPRTCLLAFTHTDDDTVYPYVFSTGISRAETLGLFELGKAFVIRKWTEDS